MVEVLQTSHQHGHEEMQAANVPDFANQLLATVASAARPRIKSCEKNFIFSEFSVLVVCGWVSDFTEFLLSKVVGSWEMIYGREMADERRWQMKEDEDEKEGRRKFELCCLRYDVSVNPNHEQNMK